MEYQHGGDVYSNEVDLDFSANINPLGLPKGVIEALKIAAESSNCYPDSQCRELRKALSEYYRLPDSYFLCGNGAADLIYQVAEAVKPKKAMVTAPAFSEYEQALRLCDCCVQRFALHEAEGFYPDMKELIEQLDESFDLIFFCNPNNPTGIAVNKEKMRNLARHCEKNKILLVVDECFCDLTDNPSCYSILEETKTLSSLAILKAFTKSYAMAGVRLGYMITSNTQIQERIADVRQPWSVSTLAQAAGIAALRETAYVEQARLLIREERAFLRQGLETMGFDVADSVANYLFFRDVSAREHIDLKEHCRKQGILIRSCQNYHGLKPWHYRICVRRRHENERLLKALSEAVETR